MPGFDGTGPLGQGPRTGGGFGRCGSAGPAGPAGGALRGMGRGCGRGFRGGMGGGRAMGRGSGWGGAAANSRAVLEQRLSALETEAATLRQALRREGDD